MRKAVLVDGNSALASSISTQLRMILALITLFRLFMSSLLMLIAMTYNAALMFACVLGLTTGYAMISLHHSAKTESKKSSIPAGSPKRDINTTDVDQSSLLPESPQNKKTDLTNFVVMNSAGSTLESTNGTPHKNAN